MSAAFAAAVVAVVTLAAPDSGAAKRRLQATTVTVDFHDASVAEVVE